MSPDTPRIAVQDRSLEAAIIQRFELWYEAGESPAEDRPGYVRAASALAWIGDELAIVQDDTSFIALRSRAGRVRVVPLPRGPRGRRRFEDALGNKADKLDLEACVVVAGPAGPRVLAFGSGSTAARRYVAALDAGAASPAYLIPAGAIYAAAAHRLGLEPSELNIEGAFVAGDRLGLVHRGTGASSRAAARTSAIVELALAPALRWLEQPDGAPPEINRARAYDLGAIGGVALGFTDVAAAGDRLVFLAAAEDTSNPVDDGAVVGVRIGVVGPNGARWGDLLDEQGLPASVKAEGIALDPDGLHAWIALDADDATRPSELCLVRLHGEGWRRVLADALAPDLVSA